LHQGKIVERGTHEELLRLKGRYGEMWEKQTKTDNLSDDGIDLNAS
jgi:ABC-type multidrug transport system fused ATPase/permease subunit